MLLFELSPDLLGRVRFAFSPMAEVGASLRLLGSPQVDHVHLPWVRRTRAELDEADRAGRGAAADLAVLTAVCPPGRWAPDVFFTPSKGPTTTIEQQLEMLAATDFATVLDDLTVVWSDRPMPAALRELAGRDDPMRRLVDAIARYWEVAVEPHWLRICAVLEDDVAYRASRAVSGGLFELFEDLHPDVAESNGMLGVRKPQHADAQYSGSELTLTPSVFLYPDLVVGHDRGKFCMTYGARGVARAWEGLSAESRQEADALEALLGRARANVLVRLSIPLTTTQLAREMEMSPANISQHLSVLRDSGLVTSWRSGRSVLYRQTALATSVIEATSTRRSLGTA